ncbi:hypothetical protein [Paenibacillus ferrarius]|uniref:hypothetical protein n=1 Tax=Paenibacillus ferrarius TaxID=1469647 RepID=UPI003D2CA30A
MGKKISMIALAAVTVLSLGLSACSESTDAGGKTGVNSPAPSGQQEAAVQAIQQGTYKFDPPVTITTVKATDSTMKFKNGETMENNVHTKWAHDQLGIDLKFLWQVPGDQFNTKLRLMLTANESLPDVLMTMDGSLMEELMQSGKYEDITADFEKYASPKVKKIYNSSPLNWQQVTIGGKKMALPNFRTAGNDNAVMWIRQDWLDKLGMKAPTTFEELETLMQAFLDKKPGGSDNVIPLGVSFGSGGSSPNPFASWLGETTWVFGPYGTVPYQWLEKDGKLVHGSTLPAMKDGLAKLKDWYNKGYISKEAGLQDENKLGELIAQGRVGVVVAPSWMSGWPQTDMQKNIPGSIMKPYPIPTLNGKAVAKDTTYLNGGLLVKKGFEHADALFLYLNRLFAGVNPEENSEFVNGWFKDYDYTIKSDGTLSSIDKDIPGGKVDPSKYFLMAPTDPFLGMTIRAKIARGETPVTPSEKKVAGGVKDGLIAARIVDDGWKSGIYVPQAYMGSSTPTMQSKQGILVKLEGDTFLSIIYGKKPIDEFDNFVKEWMSLGGENITKEVNEAYQKTKK